MNPATAAERTTAAARVREGRLNIDESDRESRWYACYTRSRHEKRVASALEQGGQQVFLPLYSSVSQWHDRKRTVEWVLFPGYVFVRIALRDLRDVLTVPGVVNVISLAGKPVPIPDSEIRSVRKFAAVLAETGEIPRPEPIVEEGWRVRVTDGPLAGVEGVVLERRGKGRSLVQVGVSAIGQGLKIELDNSDLLAMKVGD